MSKSIILYPETDQILPDYDMEVDSPSWLEESDGEIDVMLDFCNQEKIATEQQKPLPKTKKLRVLVKRLPRNIVQRYMKKKIPAKLGPSNSTASYRSGTRPIQKQSHLVRVPQEKIRQIQTANKFQRSPAALNLIRNNIKQQSLAGQQLSGSFTTRNPIPQQTAKKTNPIARRSLPNNSTTTTKTIRKPQEIGGSLESNINFIQRTAILDFEGNTYADVKKYPIPGKNKDNAKTFLSNSHRDFKIGSSSIPTEASKKIIVRNNAQQQTKIARNIRKIDFRPLATDTQIAAKTNPNTATSYQQIMPVRVISSLSNSEDIKPNIQYNNTAFSSIQSSSKKQVLAGTAVIKNATEKHLTSAKDISGKSWNSSSITNKPPNVMTPKIVKQPKYVKVPVSKLINIPQGISNSQKTEKPKPSNTTKSFETVNISKVVFKNSVKLDLRNADKMPESYKVTTQVRGSDVVNKTNFVKNPQTIRISTNVIKRPEVCKVVKLPNTQSLPAIKLINPKTFTNVASIPDKVISSKIIKVPEILTTTTTDENADMVESMHHSETAQIDNIERVECQTKAVQTKFTCNDNICGIIDTAEFKISCFYCYDAFPLRKWPVFLRHMQKFHRLDEHSQKTTDLLLQPKNLIPFATKSKEVQVNTLRGRERKRKTEDTKDEAETYFVNKTILDDMESTCDDSQLENDLEMALNALDGDDNGYEQEGKNRDHTEETSQPLTKIIKLEKEDKDPPKNSTKIEVKSQETSQVVEKTKIEVDSKPNKETSTDSKDILVPTKTYLGTAQGIKLNSHTFLKNRIINLPSNIKIIKRLPPSKEATGEDIKTTITTPTSARSTDSNKNKIVIFSKLSNLLNTAKQIKIEKEPDSCDSTCSPEFLDVVTESDQVNKINPKVATASENSETRVQEKDLDDTNTSLDISKTDVEQNVKIEPVFDNGGAEDTALLRSKDLEKQRKRLVNSKKTPVASQNTKPIPSSLLDSDDEMPSNDENEDEFPSPTNGCGILFGLTNRNIVTEFIRELQKYPELWQFNRNNDEAINYSDSIHQLCQHLNDKFNLQMTDFEMRLSIQRVKYWYCRTLQKMERHNKNQQTAIKTPFCPTFPDYYKMLSKFLTFDSNCAKDLVLGKRFQQKEINELNRYPKWMLYKDPPSGGVEEIEKTADYKCSLAKDLEYSEDADDWEQEEATRSLKPFKSELDTSNAPPDPFICDICFVDFNTLVELNRHRLRHFPPQYPCAKCKSMHYSAYRADNCLHDKKQKKTSTKPSTNTTAADRSAKEPSEAAQYVCELCGASYRSVGTLNYHKKDKHFNMRLKCPVCVFTSISNYRMLQHQKKRHVVDYGTCEEVAKKTRSRANVKLPFSAEARREYEWRREMRKNTKAGEMFYGCYKCKLVFETRKEKVQHNRQEHPITEFTVVCLLCRKEQSLFSNSTSVRRHYMDVHKVPWDEIDNLVKRTKPLFQLLSPSEVEQIKTSENPCDLVTRILAKSQKTEVQKTEEGCEISKAIKSLSDDIEEELNHTYDPFKFENSRRKGKSKLADLLMSHEEEDDDDLESLEDDYYQSTFFNDIGIDHDYDDIQDDSFYADEDDDEEFYNFNGSGAYSGRTEPANSSELHHFEYQDDEGNEHYIIEEECLDDDDDAYGVMDVDLTAQQRILPSVQNEEEIVEEVVEYDFMEDVMDERF